MRHSFYPKATTYRISLQKAYECASRVDVYWTKCLYITRKSLFYYENNFLVGSSFSFNDHRRNFHAFMTSFEPKDNPKNMTWIPKCSLLFTNIVFYFPVYKKYTHKFNNCFSYTSSAASCLFLQIFESIYFSLIYILLDLNLDIFQYSAIFWRSLCINSVRIIMVLLQNLNNVIFYYTIFQHRTIV